jgi:hypothetical protein
VQAVGRELTGRHILAHCAIGRRFGDQVAEEAMEFPRGVRDMVAAVEERRELGIVTLAGKDCIGFEHCLQLHARIGALGGLSELP